MGQRIYTYIYINVEAKGVKDGDIFSRVTSARSNFATRVFPKIYVANTMLSVALPPPPPGIQHVYTHIFIYIYIYIYIDPYIFVGLEIGIWERSLLNAILCRARSFVALPYIFFFTFFTLALGPSLFLSLSLSWLLYYRPLLSSSGLLSQKKKKKDKKKNK